MTAAHEKISPSACLPASLCLIPPPGGDTALKATGATPGDMTLPQGWHRRRRSQTQKGDTIHAWSYKGERGHRIPGSSATTPLYTTARQTSRLSDKTPREYKGSPFPSCSGQSVPPVSLLLTCPFPFVFCAIFSMSLIKIVLISQ